LTNRQRQKLSQWFRRKYKRPEGTKATPITGNTFASVLTSNLTKPPRRLSQFHFYLKKYYHERIKEEYEHRFNAAQKEFEDSSEEERVEKALKKPVAVQLRTLVGQEFWNLESAEFRSQVGEEAEDAYLKEVEEWEENQQTPKTPQQFHQ
jgi:hypothetical protein